MSNSQSYVRKMTEHFERINSKAKSYGNGHEINFKNCEWWLDMPTSVQFFDDASDETHLNPDGLISNSMNHRNYNNNELRIETAEIALEQSHEYHADCGTQKKICNEYDTIREEHAKFFESKDSNCFIADKTVDLR